MKAESKWMLKWAVGCSLPVTTIFFVYPGHFGLMVVVMVVLGLIGGVYRSIKFDK